MSPLSSEWERISGEAQKIEEKQHYNSLRHAQTTKEELKKITSEDNNADKREGALQVLDLIARNEQKGATGPALYEDTEAQQLCYDKLRHAQTPKEELVRIANESHLDLDMAIGAQKVLDLIAQNEQQGSTTGPALYMEHDSAEDLQV